MPAGSKSPNYRTLRVPISWNTSRRYPKLCMNWLLCNYLPFNERAFRRGVLAWRSSKGFSTVGYTSNPDQVISLEVLKRLVSPEIATAPQTCLDPLDGAKWARPPERVLSYVGRIQNSSLRDAMSLYGLIRAGEHGYRIYTDTSNFVGIMRRVMIEQSIKNVTAIDPNDLLFRIQKGEVGSGLTSCVSPSSDTGRAFGTHSRITPPGCPNPSSRSCHDSSFDR